MQWSDQITSFIILHFSLSKYVSVPVSDSTAYTKINKIRFIFHAKIDGFMNSSKLFGT